MKYNLGLDIGTNSVGWAVTDEHNNLIRFKKQNMWGVRLFEAAETAQKRRMFRSSRRRLQRRRTRLRLLQEIFNDHLLTEDPTFFLRLEESFLYPEDKTIKIKSNLFVDKGFTDQDYYDKYPTIYHLRHQLLVSDTRLDIRLVYLAIHNMIKYRGNFLYEGQQFTVDTGGGIENSLEDLFQGMEKHGFASFHLDSVKIAAMIEVIKNKHLSKKGKREVMSSLFDSKNKVMEELFKAIVGLQFDATKLFNDESNGEDQREFGKLKLSDDKLDELVEPLREWLGEAYEVMEALQKVYSLIILQDVLGGEVHLSTAKVKQYEKHHLDLQQLKRLMKRPEFTQAEYKNMFRVKDEKALNYYNYVHQASKCDKESLYDSIRKLFDSKGSAISNDSDYIAIKESIEREDFLMKQNNRANSMIPYQLNELELNRIIDQQAQYYPWLQVARAHILQLLKFRIPYFVGPLNLHSRNAWVVKNSAKPITPWNFYEVVNKEASAEQFIENMTSYCTYLPLEKVIPKQSLLYSKYMVLNELNKVRVNGHFLDKDTRSKLLSTLFMKPGKVKETHLVDWMKRNQLIHGSTCVIEGLNDKQFANALTPYIDFQRIFGELKPEKYDMIEDMIRWLTLFEDKKIVQSKIKHSYPEIGEDTLKQILRLRYSGWSRLSKRLLHGISITDSFQQKVTIMDHMKNTNDNLMQIVHNESLGFKHLIDEEGAFEVADKITSVIVNKLQGSPAIKRGIWQTIQIVEEIRKVMKGDPASVMIEFAREDQASRRTQSRFYQLNKIFDQIKSDRSLELISDIMKQLKQNEKQLQHEKFYLYFLQQGKCMYSLESLDIDSLHTYQVDHIIPQSYIKDDSIDNKVLVKTMKNQEKLNFALPVEMIPEGKEFQVKSWWGKLYEFGLISSKKHRNLLEKEYSEEREKGFIQRQLVETRQISKHVVQLLCQMLESDVRTIKTELTSNFRKQFNIVKNRNVNDYHHAHDAYITAVIGNYIQRKFPSMDAEFIYGEFKKYKMNNKKKNRFGFVISSMTQTSVNEDGEILWLENDSIAHVKKTLGYKDCHITKKLEEQTGQFYDQNLKKKKTGLIPMKKDLDPRKYGGYTGERSAYMVVIQHTKGKKMKKDLIAIPVAAAKIIGDDPEKLLHYVTHECEFKNVIILRRKVMKFQLIESQGELKYIVAEKEQHNAMQFIPEPKYNELLHHVNRQKEHMIDEALLDEFYQYYVQKLGNMYPVFSTLHGKLLSSDQLFRKLIVKDKIKVTNELLKITTAKSEIDNLELLGLPKRASRITKTIKIEDTYFIDQSITGLFERKVKL